MKNIVYFNGQFLPYERATIPLATHALHYGTGCFEGIRGYWNEKKKKLFVFRLKDHYRRLAESCKTLSIRLPCLIDDLCKITIELLKLNNYQEGVYIRPIVYKSTEKVTAFSLKKLDDGFAIHTTPLGHHFDVSAGVIVKGNQLITPATSENILEGITRSTIIKLAKKELEISTIERKVRKKELFTADEVFLTGTGAEVTPVIEINGRAVGKGIVGNITAKLQKLYFEIVRGENKKYSSWLTPI